MKLDLFFGCAAILLLMLTATSPVIAADPNTPGALQGLDLTDYITVFTTFLAVILSTISFIAYRRDQRSKFMLVTLAFAIFALKGVIIVGSDLLSMQQPVFDIIASLLDFLVLGCIFLSITKK